MISLFPLKIERLMIGWLNNLQNSFRKGQVPHQGVQILVTTNYSIKNNFIGLIEKLEIQIKVLIMLIGLSVESIKSPGKRGTFRNVHNARMFPQFFPGFLKKALFSASIFIFKKENLLLLHGRNIRRLRAAWKHVSSFVQAIRPCNNEETCCQKHFLRTHVSPMFPNFATHKYLSSAVKQKHILLLKTLLPACGKTGNIGETCVRSKKTCKVDTSWNPRDEDKGQVNRVKVILKSEWKKAGLKALLILTATLLIENTEWLSSFSDFFFF